MNPSLASIEHARNSLIDLGLRVGPRLLAALLIFGVGVLVSGWVARWLARGLSRIELEPPVRELLTRIGRVLVLLLFVVMALQNLGVELLPLIAGLGIAGAGIALALQGVLGNVAAGLSIIFTKPFRVGEYISIAGEEGRVETITLFSTTLSHNDRSRIVIPNRKIAGEILHNFGKIRQLDITVGVAYDSDLTATFTAIDAVLARNASVLKEPAPLVQASRLDEWAVTIDVKPWVAVSDYVRATGDINRDVLAALREHHIEIPVPRREVRLIGTSGAASLGVLALLAAMPFRLEGAYAQDAPKAPAEAPSRYTFSWPITSDPALAPRGGTTRGPEIVIDHSESDAWRALQQPNLSPLERDRRAILAMAGAYRVTFDFLEVTPFRADAKRDRPYQSWGTERVYVDRDDGRFISLSHILAMRIVQKDGTLSETFVTKHWRQDWQYEPQEIVEYRGRERWERSKVRSPAGQWSQTVYQVDESPRYAGVGTWQHSHSFSSWISGDTWRPLPRREWSVRKDYQVLIGTNRHTITSTGWVQEENNLKAVLEDNRQLAAVEPYLSREYGVARYERIQSPDFGAADEYFERTREFWGKVRDAWATRLRATPQITLRAPVDQAGLFQKLFEHAEQIAAKETPATDDATVIEASLRDMGAGPAPGR
jgi:small-conductance mechanosensitive channel